jgi:hypothetical protein
LLVSIRICILPTKEQIICFLIDGVICSNVDVYVDVIFGE